MRALESEKENVMKLKDTAVWQLQDSIDLLSEN